MKKLQLIVAAAGLTACGAGSGSKLIQVSEVQGANSAVVATVVAYVDAGVGASTHRIVRDAKGNTLFEYKLQVAGIDPGGTWRILLKPAGKGATFAASREVSMEAHDRVRVELMEDPATGRKIVDDFSLVEPETLGHHLMEVHNRIFRWVHGQ